MKAKRRFSDRGKITRTISTTTFNITYVDKETCEMKTMHMVLTGKLTEKEMLATAPQGCIGIKVDNVESNENLYVATIEDFLKVAQLVTVEQETEQN